MTGRLHWLWQRLHRSLWYRATLYSLAGMVTALVAWLATPWLEVPSAISVGASAVDSILNIMASSMLAVTTFSLSAMVTSYGSATSNVSPRANILLIEDRVTQNTLATFIGAFLFSLVGIIALAAGIYDEDGRSLLFAVTIVVVVLVVYQLIKWAGYLTRLGRVRDTIDKVETAARQALEQRMENPYLGGSAMPESLPVNLKSVPSEQIGYVQHVDMPRLSSLAESDAQAIYVQVLPGSFVHAGSVLALTAGLDDERAEAIAEAFTIGPSRHFEQDPRFGIIVLAEVASKALSPGINDPGTAIDIIGCGVRVLTPWLRHAAGGIDEAVPAAEHVYVEPLESEDLFEDFFTPIARDGASTVEIGIRLQKALVALAAVSDERTRELIRAHQALIGARFEAGLEMAVDLRRLNTVERV
ncbi:DUF2254 domain-containing protein [Salinicola rhizosphaerae]|uniref:DUF2254 domain-containing protein n=1 Tax=Salinicola rhizosphaerae TaxID=1443141 RepID=A0ABQ3E5F7_9GAMM|nr:DUF2254 domain-containing protein [Salinicola rhizosphaerae]GHB24075.1 hypothetical protein GCM10009038_23890 [Salinicola rhizosphaerae]